MDFVMRILKRNWNLMELFKDIFLENQGESIQTQGIEPTNQPKTVQICLRQSHGSDTSHG